MKYTQKIISCILCLFLGYLTSCDYVFEIPEYTRDPETEEPDPDPQPTPYAPAVNMLKYQPHNYNMWDNWCIQKGDSIHLFHLQYTRNDVIYEQDTELRGFGHATTGDLVRWNEKPEVLTLYDRIFDNDWNFRYTGCTVEHMGKYYMFYTMRKWAMQRIGVAISDDLYTWKEYEGNPVLEPDPRWFISFNADGTGSNHPVWQDIVDCRDMLVMKDKTGDGFYGYFIASADREGLNTPTTVVGVAYSNDLLNWEQKGIAYYPTGVCMPEMMDIFEYEGSWYMTLTTGKNNGSLTNFSDPYISRAMVYAKASNPEGPFIEDPADNVVIGGSINSGYSMRSIEYRGKRRTLYVDVNNGPSVLSLPKDVGLNEKEQLRLFYSSDLIPAIRAREIKPTILAQPYITFGWWPSKGGLWQQENSSFICTTDPDSWQGMVLKGNAKNIELSFTVKESTCDSYGIILSNNVEDITLNDLAHILVIEPKEKRVYLTDNVWDFKNCRYFEFEENVAYTFRMLLIGNTIELYVNEEFVFNSGLANNGNHLPGLFANNGTIQIENLTYYQLQE